MREFEEGEDIAHPGVQEDVQVRVGLARRGDAVLGERQLELHAEHVAIEIHGLAGIVAAIGDVVDARDVHVAAPAAVRS